MAFVTNDNRVREIKTRLKRGEINDAQARSAIKNLPPQQIGDNPPKYSAFGYLDWEVDLAMKAA